LDQGIQMKPQALHFKKKQDQPPFVAQIQAND
jgi:hypothetical protein